MKINAAVQAADDLIATIRSRDPARCETCRFWGHAASWLAPTTWRRCKVDGQDTSPLHVCGKYRKGER